MTISWEVVSADYVFHRFPAVLLFQNQMKRPSPNQKRRQVCATYLKKKITYGQFSITHNESSQQHSKLTKLGYPMI